MKLSIFNTFVPFDGDNKESYIAYNARTNALVLMKKDKFSRIPDLCNGVICEDDKNTFDGLVDAGIIIDDDFDELAHLKYRRSMRFRNRTMNLTIAPTMSCDFQCIYCFQGQKREVGHMQQPVMDAIVEYVKSVSPSTLNVHWYGGEPLLAISVIEKLSPILIGYCTENNIPYNASVTTNGYNLDENTAELLHRCGVNKMQITVDGPAKIHNQRRVHVKGFSTYDRIIENTRNAAKYYPIQLRINVDKNNYQQAMEVVDEFIIGSTLLPNVYPYLGLTRNVFEEYEQDLCFTDQEFFPIQMEFYRQLFSITGMERYSPMALYPQAIFSRCGADCIDDYIITPSGEMYKCWNHVGRAAYVIGNVSTGVEMNSVVFDYTNPDDCLGNTKCQQCTVLPLCFGGCIEKASQKAGLNCIPIKFWLSQYLQEAAAYLMDSST